MSSVPPPPPAPRDRDRDRDRAAAARGRPWYLVVALLAGWLLGADGMRGGCLAIQFYRADRIDVSGFADAIQDDADRAQLVTLAERYVHTMDLARTRVLPLGVGALVLGGAMVAFAALAMSGRPSGRANLVQVIGAHAALLVVTYLLTPDVRQAGWDVDFARWLAVARQAAPDPASAQQGEGIARAIFKVLTPSVVLAGELGLNVLIVVALTRPRARAFFRPPTQLEG